MRGCKVMVSQFSRFTDRARRVIDLANQEAAIFGHENLGTEHILLGLVSEGHGVAAHVLSNLAPELHLDALRAGVQRFVAPSSTSLPVRDFPLNPPATRTVEVAHEEAKRLKHTYVGTEHLLLALMRVHDGVALQMLIDAHIDPTEVRNEVFGLLGHSELIEESRNRDE